MWKLKNWRQRWSFDVQEPFSSYKDQLGYGKAVVSLISTISVYHIIQYLCVAIGEKKLFHQWFFFSLKNNNLIIFIWSFGLLIFSLSLMNISPLSSSMFSLMMSTILFLLFSWLWICDVMSCFDSSWIRFSCSIFFKAQRPCRR